MGSLVEEELGYSILCEVEQVWNPTDCVTFFSLSLLLGVASRHLFRGTRVPYTVALLVIGAALGALEYGTSHRLGRIGHGIRLWSRIDPDLLLAVFLPALLFESSFSMEFHQIKRCMAQMLLLAGPGVLISTFCIGSALKFIFPYNWSWKISLLLGGLLSATDPVAVVALLKELGASKKLNTIIEGESLMNDGTAIVVYQLFYRMILGEHSNWVAVIRYFTQVSLGAVGIGVAFGIVSTIWLRFIFNDTVMEIALTVVVSYVTYVTAQEGADVSGVLAVMTIGMFYAAIARTTFKGDGQQSLHHFWEMVAYIANTLIFILSGVVIAEGVLNSDNIFHNHGHSWGYLFLLYFFVQVSRFAVVLLLYPFLQYFGYGLNWKEATILLWAGLRGAVALSLSLSVKRASSSSMYLSSQTGSLFVFFTGGIVFLTLIVNGSTTQFFLLLLDMDKLSASKKHILEFTKYEMLNKAITAFRNLGDDEELGPVDWPSVKKYVSSLNYLEECTHPHGASGFRNSLEPSDLEVHRTWLLNGVQAAYWDMLEEGRITKETADILMHSVDEAMKSALVEPLCDWKALKDNVHISSYYKFLRTSIFLQELVTYFIVQQLESACYICAAFIRAHRIARRQLHDFIGDGDITSMVIEESKAEGEEARRVLEEVRVTFPRVLRFVKTRQVSYTVLKQLTDYIENLEEVGLLEEKEMLHLHYAIQKDLKKLLSNPPLLKIPKVTDLINAHPLMGGLPPGIRETLARSTKVMMKPRGAALYKEGSKANGVWLISNGIVKWTSKSISNKNSLHPTFTHGSTLGLWELLAGRNYIYDVVAESTVHCFYVETDKILSVLRSSPVVEDFLWQESVVPLAKVLHPRMFEDMARQELRALVAEKSMLITYIRGESVEVSPHSISFLLEGFVKTHDFQQVIAPAALLPPQNQSSQTMGTSASFSHQDSWFKVETVARVIILDVASLEASCALRTHSSSLVSSDHHHGPLRRDQCGLVSRPENCFEQRRHKQNVERIRRLANNSSAKAVRPSIFDSMVNDQSYSDSLSRNQTKMTRSVSFSRDASTNERLLVPTRSEGADITTEKRKVDNFNSKSGVNKQHDLK